MWAGEGKRVWPLPLHLHEVNHSPTGFEWGYLGSGPAQLAYEILRDATGCPPVAGWFHQQFKTAFVLHFDRDRWSLSREEVLEWLFARLGEAFHDGDIPPLDRIEETEAR